MVQVTGGGPPELVTGGGDGAVRVWDVRQPDAPVAAFPPDATGTEKVRVWRGNVPPSALPDTHLMACSHPLIILQQHMYCSNRNMCQA